MKLRNLLVGLLVICLAALYVAVAYADDVETSSEPVVNIAVMAKVSYEHGEKPYPSAVMIGCDYKSITEIWTKIQTGETWKSTAGGANDFDAFEGGVAYGYRIILRGVDIPGNAKIGVTLNGSFLDLRKGGVKLYVPWTFEYDVDTSTLVINGPEMKPAKIQKEYKFTEGMKGIFTKGDRYGLVFVADGELEELEGVMVDGEYIPHECYSLEEGSTVVTLEKWYLNSLDEGVHKLTLVYRYGYCSTQFGVKPIPVNSTGINIPKTGDTSKMGLWATLMVVSGCIATGAIIVDKKKYNK